MLFRLAILFLFGIALGGLGVSRAIEALALPQRNVSLSANDSGCTGDLRAARRGAHAPAANRPHPDALKLPGFLG
jgi:hypothetical protein